MPLRQTHTEQMTGTPGWPPSCSPATRSDPASTPLPATVPISPDPQVPRDYADRTLRRASALQLAPPAGRRNPVPALAALALVRSVAPRGLVD